MNKPKVLLTCDDYVPQTYIKAVQAVGMTPVFDTSQNADALILTGGGDVSPCFYGKTYKSLTNVNLKRDCEEMFLIKKYSISNKPILGICRGMQILNVYFGGTLFQSVAKIHYPKLEKNDSIHLLTTVCNTFLNKIYGDAFTSNSWHHQGIEKLGKNLVASAFSLEGLVEALEFKNILGVQFHPERMFGENLSSGERIFQYFKKIITNSY